MAFALWTIALWLQSFVCLIWEGLTMNLWDEFLGGTCHCCGNWFDHEPVYYENDTVGLFPFCCDTCLDERRDKIGRQLRRLEEATSDR